MRKLEIERFIPMEPWVAEVVRAICTDIGVPPLCPYAACRRTGRCSTAQVLCWQAGREVINPYIRAALGHPFHPYDPAAGLLDGRFPEEV